MAKMKEQLDFEKAKKNYGDQRSRMRTAFKRMYDTVDTGDIDGCRAHKTAFDKYVASLPGYADKMRKALDAFIVAMENVRNVALSAGSTSIPFTALPTVNFPSDDEFDPNKLKVVNAHPGGTTGAKVVEVDGIKFMLKTTGGGQGVSTDHLENEVAFNNAYRAAGVYAKAGKLYKKNGKLYSLMEYVEDVVPLGDFMRTATDAQKESVRKELLKAFPLDALFANWDVLGTSQDNVMVSRDGKRVIRIDNGSCGKFRAQGTAKKPEEWSKRTGIGELWSMRFGVNGSNINRGIFDGYTTEEVVGMAGVQMQAIEAAVATLPEADRKAMEKPLEELKLLVSRKKDMEDADMSKETQTTSMDMTHRLKTDGYDEFCPDNVSWGNFGTCRSGGRKSSATPPSPPPPYDGMDYSTKILAAVKSINHHIAKGDFTANPNTVQQAIDLKGALLKAKSWDKTGAESLLKTINDIEDSKANGYKTKIGNFTSVVISQDPDEAKKIQDEYQKKLDDFNKKNKKKSSFVSLTDQIHSTISSIGGDPQLISDGQAGQGSDSWNGSACRIKYLEISLRGDDIDGAVKKGAWDGNGHSNGLKNAQTYYKSHPDEFEMAKKTLASYKAGIQMFLANTDFPGNDRKNRRVFLIRTESKRDVVDRYNLKPGTVVSYPISTCESFGTCGRVSVYGGETMLVWVPYDRIIGTSFLERTPGSNHCCYLSDGEKETTADIVGNPFPVVYCGDKGKTFKGYMDYYKSITGIG